MMRVLIAALSLAILPVSASATEEPAHTVVESDGRFEIREYEAFLVAEVEVEGRMGQASNRGFRPLFNYISGRNTARQSIDMTAPVTRQPVAIDMTAPVISSADKTDAWTVAFVMPADWTMDTLPIPDNPDVKLREEPAARMAVVRFSGRASDSAFAARAADLDAWLETRGLRAVGAPRYAGYDAPYVPGPFRRNEVMIPIAAD